MTDRLTMKELKSTCDVQEQKIADLEAKMNALEAKKQGNESICGVLKTLTCWIMRNKNQVGIIFIILMVVSTFSHWNRMFDFSFAMLMLLVFVGAIEYGSDTLQEKYREAVRKLDEA